jgi:hypothetical protein
MLLGTPSYDRRKLRSHGEMYGSFVLKLAKSRLGPGDWRRPASVSKSRPATGLGRIKIQLRLANKSC